MSSLKTGKEEVADICERLQKNKPFALGIAITVVYLFGLYCYLIKKWDCIVNLAPNNLGDFLAGAFGPLAFAWLVLGYFQQSYELRQNNSALKLQANELKISGKQHKNIVRTEINNGLRRSRLAKPRFEINQPLLLDYKGVHDLAYLTFEIQNKSSEFYLDEIYFSRDPKGKDIAIGMFPAITIIEKASNTDITLALAPGTRLDPVFPYLIIKYTDSIGNTGFASYGVAIYERGGLGAKIRTNQIENTQDLSSYDFDDHL